MLTRSSDSKPPQTTPLRRSARLLSLKTSVKSLDFDTRNPNSQKNPSSSTVKISKKPIQSSNVSTNRVNPSSGLRRSPTMNNGSSSNEPEANEFVETKKEREIFDGVTVEKRESERRDVGVKRKRKEQPVFQGWTREQELSLQRAYFSAKPTPNFWKRVSKLVPGKSAQDCFDRIHFDQLTPNQPKTRSRAKRTNLSPVEPLLLSASKVLNPPARRSKSSGCGKQKSYLAQKKTVRHLLRKHCLVDEGDEADMFSVLEPEISSHMHVVPTVMFSTPKNLLEKQGFLHNCHERSSSGSKKQQSKLGNSCTRALLVSPPVLKQIKNRALHEKYIDQLHNREAKRKAESARGRKIIGKENKGSNQIQVDKVKEAKNALVSDATFVINQLQHLQTTSVDSSLDFDNDGDDKDDDDDIFNNKYFSLYRDVI